MTLPCIILAGGLGTRMLPRTERVPKVLLPVLGRPFATWQLEWLRSESVERVVFCIGHMGQQIREHVGDGSRFGLRVDYVEDGEVARGTGGAVRSAVEAGVTGAAFFVVNGDSFLSVRLDDVEHAFLASQCPALMTVMLNDDRWDASNAVVEDGRVTLYDKRRPSDGRARMRWIDYGISVLRDDIVVEAIPAGAAADVADLMRDLSIRGRLAAYEVTERFYEIGSPAGLRDLEAHLTTRA
jgi:N-acetyl-alpha-D-muramate 1-phosphate uridylyltransferase